MPSTTPTCTTSSHRCPLHFWITHCFCIWTWSADTPQGAVPIITKQHPFDCIHFLLYKVLWQGSSFKKRHWNKINRPIPWSHIKGIKMLYHKTIKPKIIRNLPQGGNSSHIHVLPLTAGAPKTSPREQPLRKKSCINQTIPCCLSVNTITDKDIQSSVLVWHFCSHTQLQTFLFFLGWELLRSILLTTFRTIRYCDL